MALGLEPDGVVTLHSIGQVYRALRRFDDALASFRSVLELEPRNIRAHNSIGQVYLGLRQFDDALAAFERVLRINSRDATALTGKGQTLRARGEFDNALSALQEAVENNPKNDRARYSAAKMLFTRGDFGPARTLLAPLLQGESPTPAAVYLFVACITDRDDPAWTSIAEIIGEKRACEIWTATRERQYKVLIDVKQFERISARPQLNPLWDEPYQRRPVNRLAARGAGQGPATDDE
jgi:tetratricopeptide (TPR) repeat protein